MTKNKNTVPSGINSLEYIEDFCTIISKDKNKPVSVADLDNLHIYPDQLFYTIDYRTNVIPYSRGTESLLGYTQEEFDIKLIFNDYLHPLQRPILQFLINIVAHLGATKAVFNDSYLSVIHKVRHKKGHYITVLRKARILEGDKNGKLITGISVLTDMTSLVSTEAVTWKIVSPNFDPTELKHLIDEQIKTFFSRRELEILNEIKKGRSSQKTGEKLHISKHTVDTHRRNMLKKTGAKNTVELIKFATLNNIL